MEDLRSAKCYDYPSCVNDKGAYGAFKSRDTIHRTGFRRSSKANKSIQGLCIVQNENDIVVG